MSNHNNTKQFQSILNWVTARPKRLFCIDGLGALLSAFLLGVVLVRLEGVFGIPVSVLYLLAFLPCLFAVYDGCCYLFLTKNIGPFLRIIAVANLLYCCLSIGLAVVHRETITSLGWVYILAEVAIVGGLAWVEARCARM